MNILSSPFFVAELRTIGSLCNLHCFPTNSRFCLMFHGINVRLKWDLYVFYMNALFFQLKGDFLDFFGLQKRRVIRMVAETDDYDLKQMKDMAAARKRWDSLVLLFSQPLFHFRDAVSSKLGYLARDKLNVCLFSLAILLPILFECQVYNAKKIMSIFRTIYLGMSFCWFSISVNRSGKRRLKFWLRGKLDMRFNCLIKLYSTFALP